MDFQGYPLNFQINGSILDFSPGDFSFSLKDSLFKTLPEGSFKYHDRTTLFHEYRLLMSGAEFAIQVGSTEEENVDTRWLVNAHEGMENLRHGFGAYHLDFNLTHPVAGSLDKKMVAYEGTATDFITQMFEGLGGLKAVEVTPSTFSRIWYRTGMTQLEFVQNVLLPNTINQSYPNSPYFFWVTSDNKLHFKDWKTLLDQNSKADFYYQSSVDTSANKNLLTSVLPVSEAYRKQYINFHRTQETISEENYSITTEEMPLLDRIQNQSSVTGSIPERSDYFYGGVISEEELPQVQGQENLLYRKGMMAESYLITTMGFYPELHAGDKISLSIIVENDSGRTESLYASGDYIIETSNHIWDADSKSGVSELMVSRDSVKWPNTHNRSAIRLGA